MWRNALALAALCILTAQTPAPTTSSECPLPDNETGAFLQAATFAVKAPRGPLSLTTVADEATRERGLMCVTRIPHGRGMIFVFPAPDGVHDFWMKNTLVNLDMLFVGVDGRVTSVTPNVPATKDGTADKDIAHRAGLGRYVIELGAGDAARHGIKLGTTLHLPSLKALE